MGGRSVPPPRPPHSVEVTRVQVPGKDTCPGTRVETREQAKVS